MPRVVGAAAQSPTTASATSMRKRTRGERGIFARQLCVEMHYRLSASASLHSCAHFAAGLRLQARRDAFGISLCMAPKITRIHIAIPCLSWCVLH